jgi:hypothetical protein
VSELKGYIHVREETICDVWKVGKQGNFRKSEERELSLDCLQASQFEGEAGLFVAVSNDSRFTTPQNLQW